ncbi:MAG TPA: nitroreductase/quinone reductase family protein [Methylomirabilota bacterium]|jgi:deazaflavin-dependent oxidoreductase (nitroreductase family)|nr:nitroreductase/quinone reductase family protein [Methylomirabilota bacterium]
MDDRTRRALERDRTIDITTTGRATGRARRVEIWFHNLDGRLYITGTPGSRDWYANLRAHPELTFHLKESARADLPARAMPVLEPAERRRVLSRILQNLGHAGDLEAWLRESPLVEVEILNVEADGRKERR